MFATPKNYLDFLSCYIDALEGNRTSYNDIIQGYETGLTTLKKSKDSIEVMSNNIAIEKEKVAKRKDIVEKLARDVHASKKKAEIQKAEAEAKEIELEKQNIIIGEEQIKAQKLKDQKEPEYQAALEEIKNIKAKDLGELGALGKVTPIISDVAACLLILRVDPNGSTTSFEWNDSRKILGNSTKPLLLKYHPMNAQKSWIKAAEKKYRAIEDQLTSQGKEISQISRAVEGLFKWVRSCLDLYDSFKEIKRLTDNVNDLTAQSKKLSEDLDFTKKNLKELDKSIAELSV